MTTYRVVIAAALGSCIGGGCTDGSENLPQTGADASTGTSGADAGDVVFSGPVVELTTSMGTLVVLLAGDRMPNTTANFLTYVDAGFYDDTLVHRVLDDWVIQGGGYSPGLVPKLPNLPINLETHPAVGHVHGAISMARTNELNSATSQWFIVDWPASGTPSQPAQLDGLYAAFGVVIDGFPVLGAITQVATTSSSGLDDVPITDIVVTSAQRR